MPTISKKELQAENEALWQEADRYRKDINNLQTANLAYQDNLRAFRIAEVEMSERLAAADATSKNHITDRAAYTQTWI